LEIVVGVAEIGPEVSIEEGERGERERIFDRAIEI
jgi:hypothetical protein